MARLTRDWRALAPEQRLAGVAAVALFLTMLLPWYQQNAVVSAPKTTPLQSQNLNAFQAFSFIEAAVLLVAIAVVYLLYARAEGHEFHLPGSDGTVVMVAGGWTALLLIVRLFDKPGITTHGIAANVGVQWGIFFALAAAGLLTYAGSRMRAARRPEPPLRRDHSAEPTARTPRTQPPQQPARYPDPLDTAPSSGASSSEVPPSDMQPHSRAGGRPRRPPAPPAPPPDGGPVRAGRSSIARRPVAAHPVTEQLSFDDPTHESQ